jgi:hypothetical protein
LGHKLTQIVSRSRFDAELLGALLQALNLIASSLIVAVLSSRSFSKRFRIAKSASATKESFYESVSEALTGAIPKPAALRQSGGNGVVEYYS